jgi:D-amino peptidase
MKLLIAVDMEGISGVVSWDQVTPGQAEYERFRKIMTTDVNAAVAGAAEAGATEIIIADGHWNSTNILIETLDSRARLVSGSPSPFSMVEGIDTGVDAALFVGYHARIGTANAILDHTWSSARIANLGLNGRLTGETGFNAAVCGHFNVPVLMVSGDQSVCAEARDFLGPVATAQVKRAVSRFAAECLPLVESQALIHDTAFKAVQAFQAGQHPQPYKVATPVEVTVEFKDSDMADRAILLPGAARQDGRILRFTAGDIPTAYRSFRAAVTLAART